jgi:hypothetical protein
VCEATISSDPKISGACTHTHTFFFFFASQCEACNCVEGREGERAMHWFVRAAAVNLP